MDSCLGGQQHTDAFLCPTDVTRKTQSGTRNVLIETGLQQAEVRKVRKNKKEEIIWSKIS